MILLVLTFLFLIGAVLGPRFIKDYSKRGYGSGEGEVVSLAWARWTARGACVVLAFICVASTSILYIDQDEVGHLKRIYGGDNMPANQVLAAPWQKGAQARTLQPGFKFITFIKVFYDVETQPLVTVPEGSYGFLIAKDGAPLRDGQYLADDWKDADAQKMIDAEYFLGFSEGEDKYTGARGQKGPQLAVLKPGQYRINRYLFDVKQGASTNIEAGFVGVVKSNVGEAYTGDPLLPTGVDASDLSVPIVPKGNQGVWKQVLEPGRYYMNEKAYKITKIDTRVQTWKYLGGYKRRIIDLKIGDDGKIEQTERGQQIDPPKDAADKAIILRVEGWDVYQDSRVQVQVTPENASFVVASVGTIQAVEDKIITPNYRSIVRNVVAEDVPIRIQAEDANGLPLWEDEKQTIPKMIDSTRPRQVLDLLYDRENLERMVGNSLIPAGAKAGLTVQWVRFGDPVVPPELLVPGKRKQLADQLKKTYEQEQSAQFARVQTEKARARADQQAVLMKSEIGIQVATNDATAREKRGEGEEKFMKAVARGQEAQANVLGKEKAFELAYVEKVLDAAKSDPRIIKMPGTLVMGSGSGLTGAAAILGANNLTMGLTKGKLIQQGVPAKQ